MERISWLWLLIGVAAGVLIALATVHLLGRATIEVGAWAAAVTTFGGLIIGALLTRSTERERWLREQRLEWCGRFVDATYRMQNIGLVGIEPTAVVDETLTAHARVAIISPAEAQRLAMQLLDAGLYVMSVRQSEERGSPLFNTAHKRYIDHWHSFLAYARREMGLDEHRQPHAIADAARQSTQSDELGTVHVDAWHLDERLREPIVSAMVNALPKVDGVTFRTIQLDDAVYAIGVRATSSAAPEASVDTTQST